MKLLFTLTACFVIFFTSKFFAQSSNIEWSKTFGGSHIDVVSSIKKTSDGGFILSGNSRSSDVDVLNNEGLFDIWIVKLDDSGNVAWRRSMGGSYMEDATDIIELAEGGYIVVGSTNSIDGDISFNHGGTDLWVVKLSIGGSILWERTFGGTSTDLANSVIQTTDGGFAIAGKSNSEDGDVTGHQGNSDFWVVKLDAGGNLEWQKTVGGSSTDEAYSILQSNDSGFIVVGNTGSSDGDVSNYYGQRDYWVVKLDSLGTLVWEKNYGGSHQDYAYSALSTSDGNFVILGNSLSSDEDVTNALGSTDGWMIKIDTLGNLIWEKSIGNSSWNKFWDIKETSDGGFILGGESDVYFGITDAHVVKTDANGTVLFEGFYGGTSGEIIYSVLPTSDSGVVFAATTRSNDGDVLDFNGATDIWVVKLNAALSITENNLNKPTLVKVTNLLGQEVQLDSPGVLIYVYSDGSTRKMMRVE